jgi:hypothetical protein
VLTAVARTLGVGAFGDDARTKRAIAALQEGRRCWCGGTRWHGRECMRISISSWSTTQEDMAVTLKAIVDAADRRT